MKRVAVVVMGSLCLTGLVALSIFGRDQPSPPNTVEEGRGGLQQKLKAYERRGQEAMDGAPRAGDTSPVAVDSIALVDRDLRLVALSPAEVAWMRKHGYPTSEELDEIQTVSLTEMAGVTDAKAATLYGMALLQKGDVPGGIAVLETAAIRGSIFAYEQSAVADYELMKRRFGDSPELRNVLRAKLEVAANLGDHRVVTLLDKHLPGYDVDANAAFVRAQTSEYLRQLGTGAQALGVTAPGPDPRPNQKQWSDIDALMRAGESERIDIYGY